MPDHMLGLVCFLMGKAPKLGWGLQDVVGKADEASLWRSYTGIWKGKIYLKRQWIQNSKHSISGVSSEMFE